MALSPQQRGELENGVERKTASAFPIKTARKVRRGQQRIAAGRVDRISDQKMKAGRPWYFSHVMRRGGPDVKVKEENGAASDRSWVSPRRSSNNCNGDARTDKEKGIDHQSGTEEQDTNTPHDVWVADASARWSK